MGHRAMHWSHKIVLGFFIVAFLISGMPNFWGDIKKLDFFPPKAKAATFQMQTGYYGGTGASLSITGLGFQPDLVVIKADSAAGLGGVWKSSAMPADTTAYLQTTANDTATQITLDSEGFTLSSSANVNSLAIRFTWIAFGGSDCTSSGTFCVNSYTGDGQASKTITSGFSPDVAWIKGPAGANNAAVWHSTSTPDNYSLYFQNTNALTDGTGFKTFTSTGFTIGNASEVNTNATTYYYVAFKEVANVLETGHYLGNGSDSRSISVGFQPDFVLLKNSTSSTAQSSAIHSNHTYGDFAGTYDDLANDNDFIQALESNGFQVGANNRVNKSLDHYYWAAFKGANSGTASGSFKMATGTYAGSGGARSITGLGFRPDLVIIKSSSTNQSVFATSLMGPDQTAYFANAAANFIGAITSLDNDGFTLATDATVNSSGIAYYWEAFGNAWSPVRNSGAADFAVGIYTANEIDSRNITGVPFQPNLISVKRDGTSLGVWKSSSMSGEVSAFFGATADDASNTLQALNSDGFQLGLNNEVSVINAVYYWFAFKSGQNFTVNSYTGSGAADITTAGFQPNLVWVKRTTAVAGVHRPSSLTGDNTLYFPATASASGRITAFLSNGFSVGNNTETGTSGGTYRYTAWKIPQSDFTQSAYRWFANDDSTNVSTALAAQDTAMTAPSEGTAFRLRLLLHAGASSSTAPSDEFKLQFAVLNGEVCDNGGEVYADVGGATSTTSVIRFYDNASVSDETALTATSTDPVHSGHTVVNQTYQEANNFTLGTQPPAEQDAKWDFALVDNGATAGTTYCFRAVYSNAHVLSSYSVFPQVTIPSRTITQSVYRWFENLNSTSTATALAVADSAATTPEQGTPFRLRLLLHVAGKKLATSTTDFKLQFATKSGTCDTAFSGETYADVGGATSTTAIRFYDNSAPFDEEGLSASSTDPVHGSDTIVNQSYQEKNNFNNINEITPGKDGKWDFALNTTYAAANTSYCFRVMNVGNPQTQIDTYSVIPEITTRSITYEESAYRWFGNTVSSDVASNVIDTSTSATSTKLGFQRKLFYDSDNSLWWAFHANGSAIEYLNSSDGSTWTSRGTVAINTSDFSLLRNGSSVYLAYQDPAVGTKAQKGTLGATSISWGSATTVFSNTANREVVISQDSNGKLWVGWYFPTGANEDFKASRSTNANDTSAWDANITIRAGGTLFNIANLTMSPLTSGDMYFVWIFDDTTGPTVTIEGRKWNDGSSSLESVTTIDTVTVGTPGGDESIISTTADGAGGIYALYHNCSNSPCTQGTIKFARFSSGSWSTAITLDSNTTNEYPSLTIDSNTNTLYAFWIRSNTVYFKRGVSPHSSTEWDASATTLVSSGTNAWLSSAHHTGGGLAAFIWTEGTGSPYNVRFFGQAAESLGSALAAQDTAATAPEQGTAFRLRLLLHVGNFETATSSQAFKLQFAAKSGTCDTAFSGETYADVGGATSTTAIRFYDNGGVSDESALGATSTDPVHSTHTIVNQSYQEANNFTNNQGTISAGKDGKWDFALVDYAAVQNTGYCFRVVTSSGSTLDTYSVIPEITVASITYTQSAYRLFNNADSAGVSGVLAAQDTSATLASSSAQFRLRILLHVGGSQIATSSQDFKLQFATKSGTCDTAFSGETYADVGAATSTSAIRYYNNSSPADEDALLASGSDPTHSTHTIVNQTYQEAFQFANTQGAITAGKDGKWDFALEDNSGLSATSYCFRAVKSGGSTLDTYSAIPEVTTATIVGASTYTQSAYRWFANGAAAGFDTDGIIDGAAVSETANAIAKDATYMYVAGFDSSANWRIEKRLLSTGALDTGFDTDGIIDGAAASNIAYGIAVDSTYMYVAGSNTGLDWRIEKRLLTTGALDTDFGTSGVVTVSAGETAYAIAIDATYMYVVGSDDSANWRIEKRLLTTGALDTGFDTDGIIDGVAASSVATAIAIDATYMYVAGYNSPADWRIEKRLLTTGALDTGFNTDGVVEGATASNTINAIAIDSGFMYITGDDSNTNWRTEKRSLATGALDTGFGTNGVITGSVVGVPYGIRVDATSLYLAGYSTGWRIEKRLLSTGALDSTFGTSGVVTGAGTSNVSYALTIDATYLYAAGDNSSTNWRIEKRLLSNGNLIGDGNNPGPVLAAQDTAATAPQKETPFRLRMLLHVASNDLATSGQAFKLQFATKSGTCDTSFSGETYADVGESASSTAFRFYDNAGASDNSALSATSTDPTHGGDTVVSQTYEEGNSFTNSQGPIPSVQDGKWDFSLIDNSASAGTAYCFRAVKNDGTTLDTYSVIPELTANGGTLNVNFVNTNGISLNYPNVGMDVIATGYSVQTVTATFGKSDQKIRVLNTTSGVSWSLTVAARATTATWENSSSTAKYDYNDSTASAGDGGDADSVGGQMSMTPSAGIITPQSGCTSTGISLGSASAFSEGVTNSLTLLSAGGSASTNCYWDLTSVSVSQTIPTQQANGIYSLFLDLTVTAS